MNPIEWHQIHQDTRNAERTYVEIFNENDLSDLVEQEPSDENDEVPPPKIVDIERVSGGDVRGPIHRVQTRGSAEKSTRLVRADDFGVLGQAWRVSWDDVVAVAPQSDAHELVVHQSTPSWREIYLVYWASRKGFRVP